MQEEFNSVQTRSEINGIQHFDSFKEALQAANNDRSIWKISFYHKTERIRLVRHGYAGWIYEQKI